MMNKKEAFLRYLNGECTSRDFNLAREYAAHASLEEKELFNQRNNEIAKTGLEKLVSTQPFDLAVVDNFLMKQGVSKEYFQLLLHYYLVNHPHDMLVEQFYHLLYLEYIQDLDYLFTYAKNVAWNTRQLHSIAKKYHMDQYGLEKLLAIYAKKNLGIDSYTNYKVCYLDFLNFFTDQIKVTIEKEHAYTYYQKYATSQEKEKFESYIKYILDRYKKKVNAQENTTAFLHSLSLNLYDLYLFTQFDFIHDFSYQNILVGQAKKYYDLCASVSFDPNKVASIATIYQMSCEQFLTLAKFYAREVLHFDIIHQSYTVSKNHYKKKVYFLLEAIKDEEDTQKIFDCLSQAHVKYEDILMFCYGFHCELPLEKQRSLEQKFSHYLAILQQNKMAPIYESLPKKSNTCDSIFEDYLNSELTLEEFCKEKNMAVKTFKKKVNGIKEKELALKIKDKLQQEKIKSNQLKEKTCHEVICYIREGINDHGNKRAFTLLDYFILFKDNYIHQFVYSLLNLTAKDKQDLRKFFLPLQNASRISNDNIANLNLEFHSLKDEKGFPIKGTGILLTKEELSHLADYLELENLPMLDVIVHLAAREYVDGNLVIESLQKL